MASDSAASSGLDMERFVRRDAVWKVAKSERIRAHMKHGDTSMEALPVTDMTRLSVLMEEVGEVAREFNEARHRTHADLLPQAEREQSIDLSALYNELIQVTAMAGAWADRVAVEMTKGGVRYAE